MAGGLQLVALQSRPGVLGLGPVGGPELVSRCPSFLKCASQGAPQYACPRTRHRPRFWGTEQGAAREPCWGLRAHGEGCQQSRGVKAEAP